MKNLYKGKHFRILKSLSVKLSDDVYFLLTYMYYTDRRNKDNNQYRYEGSVLTEAELDSMIAKLEDTPNLPWKWGNPIPDDFIVSYHSDTNRIGASYFKARKKKILSDFSEFLAKANENPVKRYPMAGYVLNDGSSEVVDIQDKERLLSLVGKTFSHVRDRAERTFDSMDPERKFKRYNSRVGKK